MSASIDQIVDHQDQNDELDNEPEHQDSEYIPSKRKQYILAKTDKDALDDEFKQHVAQLQAADPNNMNLEWWTAREKGFLRDKILNQLYQVDRNEINSGWRNLNPLKLTPELDEKIKQVADKLTSKMLEDIAEYTATIPNVNYNLIKERVLYKIHPGNYESMERAIYEQHPAFAENIDTDLLTDEIDAIHAINAEQ